MNRFIQLQNNSLFKMFFILQFLGFMIIIGSSSVTCSNHRKSEGFMLDHGISPEDIFKNQDWIQVSNTLKKREITLSAESFPLWGQRIVPRKVVPRHLTSENDELKSVLAQPIFSTVQQIPVSEHQQFPLINENLSPLTNEYEQGPRRQTNHGSQRKKVRIVQLKRRKTRQHQVNRRNNPLLNLDLPKLEPHSVNIRQRLTRNEGYVYKKPTTTEPPSTGYVYTKPTTTEPPSTGYVYKTPSTTPAPVVTTGYNYPKPEIPFTLPPVTTTTPRIDIQTKISPNKPPPPPTRAPPTGPCRQTKIKDGHSRFDCEPGPSITNEHILWLKAPTGSDQTIDISIPNYNLEEQIKAAIKASREPSQTLVNILLEKPETIYDVQKQDEYKLRPSEPIVNLEYESIPQPSSIHYPTDQAYNKLTGKIREP